MKSRCKGIVWEGILHKTTEEYDNGLIDKLRKEKNLTRREMVIQK